MMLRSRLSRFLVAACLAFVAAAAAAALPPDVTQGPSVEGVTEYRLANGLTVLLFPDASKSTTTVNVTYRVGSAHESYGETGMAHLLEHLVFKGTPARGNLHAELDRRGMRYNGTTDFDRTNYFESFNASGENLAWALEMEADRMVNSWIRRSDLDTEMTVVRNEFERGETMPLGVLRDKMYASAFQWHNYGHTPIGARSDIENVDIGRLQAFYRLYYQPDNAVLTVAGKFDPEATLALIAKHFGPIPKPARTLPAIYTVEPVQDGERSVTLRRVGNSKYVGLMYHIARGADPDFVPTDVLADVLTMEPAGRMYQSLVPTKKASSVMNSVRALRDPGVLMIFAQIPDGDEIAPAREAMFATIEALRREPVTDEEVARVRARAAKYFDEILGDPQHFGIAISESIALGDWRLFFLMRDAYRNVKAADVNRVAQAWLKRSNVTVGEYVPDAQPDRVPAAAAVDIAALLKDYKGDAATVTGEAFDAGIANLEARTRRFTLPNGARVALLPKKTRGESVDFAVTLRFGDEKAVFGKSAEGQTTASLLMRGTTTKSRQQVEDAFDRLRAKVAVGGGATSVTASGQTYRKELPDTLRLVAEVLRTPALAPDELETLKRQATTALEASRTEPQAAAQRALAREGNPYPVGDPRYAPTLDESLAWTSAVTPDAVRRFHAGFYGASNAEIAIVGDFDADAVKALLTQLFGDWKSPAPYARVPDPPRPDRAAEVKLELPDKANAMLIGREALAVNDTSPDYPALLVANHLFGGTASSRLFERVRQKEGLSYSIGSFFVPNAFEANSRFGVYAIFAPENLGKVRAAIDQEFARVAKDGFTDAEVKAAKDAVLQQRHLARNQDGSVAEALGYQAWLGRTWAQSGAVDDAIAKLTAADVTAAFRKYVRPDAFTVVFAGDFAKGAR